MPAASRNGAQGAGVVGRTAWPGISSARIISPTASPLLHRSAVQVCVMPLNGYSAVGRVSCGWSSCRLGCVLSEHFDETLGGLRPLQLLAFSPSLGEGKRELMDDQGADAVRGRAHTETIAMSNGFQLAVWMFRETHRQLRR